MTRPAWVEYWTQELLSRAPSNSIDYRILATDRRLGYEVMVVRFPTLAHRIPGAYVYQSFEEWIPLAGPFRSLDDAVVRARNLFFLRFYWNLQ